MPIILSAPAKRKNGARRDVLSEDARKSGYYVATYSPGDGKTRYRFFDLADMARRGVSTAEQDYFGPLNGIHTAVGLAAAKKFLNAPAKRKNPSRGYVCVSDRYCPTGDEFSSLADFQRMCVAVFGERARLKASGGNYVDEHGEVVLRPVTAAKKAPAKRKNARKASLPPMRNNGSRSTVDPVAARELELYIENEANLVGPGNSLGANIMRMLAGRIVRGTYDSTKAWRAWVPLTTEGAKRYKREIGPINASKATRDAVATRLSEAFESEVRSGGIDPMKLLGKR